MEIENLIAPFLASVNEVLAAGIVVVATSMLLYNLTRDLNNRVARASGFVLACVTFAYVIDVFASLEPDLPTLEIALRLQWLGLAFIPGAMFHLSDSLLDTTGLPSRGRRRSVIRILYGISALFLVGALFTDVVVQPITTEATVSIQPGSAFVIYVAYFITAMIVTIINVNRARRRCLTNRTKRRMTYLLIAILTPAVGIFPYSVLLNPGQELSITVQILVNLANIFVISMLVFLSYPLSFFGSDKPDRVVKVELLRFLLRGPGTALLALAVIVFTQRGSDILGLPGEVFMPFAVVAVVLLWQWTIDLALPYLEKQWVYGDADDDQLARLQELSDRILTRDDLEQLILATLEALCDYLRTTHAYVLLRTGDQLELSQSVGTFALTEDELQSEAPALLNLASQADRVTERSAFQRWKLHQIVPLYSKRISSESDDELLLIGILGVETAKNPVDLVDTQDTALLYTLVQRTEQTLDDIRLQEDIFASLEGLLPQIHMTRTRAEAIDYRPGRTQPQPTKLPPRDEVYDQVWAALKHYWGGPGLMRSRLLEMEIVQEELKKDDNPAHALRSVLQTAIEQHRPEGERSMTLPEWTIYNILNMRFVEKRRVRDVARRMSISEANLYRKQRTAIEAVTDTLLDMERQHQSL